MATERRLAAGKGWLADQTPELLAIVIAVTLILLFRMTGSIVLALEAVLMNALSRSPTFGIVV